MDSSVLFVRLRVIVSYAFTRRVPWPQEWRRALLSRHTVSLRGKSDRSRGHGLRPFRENGSIIA